MAALLSNPVAVVLLAVLTLALIFGGGRALKWLGRILERWLSGL